MNLWVVAVSMLIVMIEGFVSWKEGTFTRRQLNEVWKADERGLKTYPFNLHGGMWSDLFVLPWIFGAAAEFASQWSMTQIAVMYVLSGVVSVFMHYVWSSDDAIGGHCLGRQFTLAGLIHAMYMQAALTIILLLFVCTRGLSDQAVLIISIAMGVHIFLGMVQPTLMGNGGKMTRVAWLQSIISAVALLVAYRWLLTR